MPTEQKIVLGPKENSGLVWNPIRGWIESNVPTHVILDIIGPRPFLGDNNHSLYPCIGGTLSEENIAELYTKGVVIEYRD